MKKIIYANKANPIRHAFYREYRELQSLCLFILQQQKHEIGYGNKKIYGILFDGSWLWEEYINHLIRDDFYHPMNKLKQGTQYLFSKDICEKCGKIYPDFISKNPENMVIADEKYKPVDNIRGKDYLQVLAYMLRFDSKLGFYIYPEKDYKKNKVMHLYHGFNENDIGRRDEDNDIVVIKQGLIILSECKDYDDFSDKIKNSEEKFKKYLSDCIKLGYSSVGTKL